MGNSNRNHKPVILIIYETDKNLCPLCAKISATYTSSEKMIFNAVTGYMADLILSLVTLRTSKMLGNTVSRYDISKALRLMEVTKISYCVSGIFKIDEHTDAISDYAGIYLDRELIPQSELEAFLKIS